MKKYFLVLLAALCVVMSACASVSPSDEAADETTAAAHSGDDDEDDVLENSNISYSHMNADWPAYSSADELVDTADAVFLGKVTDISFAVLDMTNGMPATESTDLTARELYTLYKFDILTVYKGDVSGRTHIKVPGGLQNYNEDYQTELLVENGMISPNNTESVLVSCSCASIDIQVGKTYLFAISSSENESLFNIMNPNQSAFDLDSPTQASPLQVFSLKDVLTEFGNDKWEEFYQNWSENKYA